MSDPLRFVAPGQPSDDALLDSRRVNAWNEVARVFRAARSRFGGDVLEGGVSPSLTTYIRNATAVAQDVFAVYAIGDCPISPLPSPHDFLTRPVFDGIVPGSATDQIVIAPGPLAVGTIGAAIIQGVAIVEVLLHDLGHTFARPIPGVTGYLESATSGPARILWIDEADASFSYSATDTVLAAVLLGAGGGGTAGGDWKPGTIVARLGDGPQASYTVQPVKLMGTTYEADGAEKTPCYRIDTKDYDETDLIPIPDDCGVLWRPSEDDPAKYEITPWGGVKKVVKKELVFTCTRCIETETDVWQQVTTNVYRRLAHFARDFRVTWKPAITEEGPIEDDLEETP